MANNKEGAQLSLLALQSRMKCDPQGYEDELLLQLRHFQACLSVFQLHSSSSTTSLPSSIAGDPNAAKELAEMTMFLAHVTPFYPQHLCQFPHQILGLLRSTGDSLQPNLRRQLTQALILLRNRQMIELVEILPVLMELQTLGDRALRKLASLHIVQDIRRMNLKHKNEAKNRALQNVLFHLLEDDNEARSKRALIVLCDLHRRKLWVDERTANAICNACLHKSSRIMKAALSFLLGYEQVDDEDEAESSDDDAQEHNPSVTLSREAVYKAHHKGTASSRRKKQAKLQRVMRSLKKQQRSQAENSDWSTAPLQQLHDPQGFAEKLFSRLQNCNERFEVKLMMMKVISRAVGLHRLILLNFYPFLQKYVQPHQRDVTHVLASAVQACHDMVPPDAVESLLRQLVNQFVHDRARPEVIAVGLNVVREMCVRMPLIMTRDLLHDLAMYKKSREKAVSSAARSIVTVFRQVFPSLLEKKDRGKGADLLVKPKAFGENVVPSNVPGIELLAGPGEDSEDLESSDALSDDGCDDADGDSIGQDEISSELGEEEDGEEDEEKDGEDDGEEECEDEGAGEDETVSEMGSSEEEDGVVGSGEDTHSTGDDPESDDNVSQESREKRQHDCEAKVEQDQDHGHKAKRQKLDSPMDSGCSLRELKKIVGARSSDHDQFVKTEDDCILSNEDFKRIKKLQAKKLARAVLAEHGIGKQGKKKEEAIRIPSSDHIHERRVNPASLEANIRRRRGKEERIASVRAGQEERGVYRSRASVKQKKTGGLSNRQKEKRKSMPLAAKRATAAKSRNQKKAKRRSSKQFRGKKAWKQ